jgi:hypothetical protein
MVATAQTTVYFDQAAPDRTHDGSRQCQAYMNLQDARAAAAASCDAVSELRDALGADGPDQAPA